MPVFSDAYEHITFLDPIKNFRPGDVLITRQTTYLYPTYESMMNNEMGATPVAELPREACVFVIANIFDEEMNTADYLLITPIGCGWTFINLPEGARTQFYFLSRP